MQASRSLRLAAGILAATALLGLGGVVVAASAVGALPLSASSSAKKSRADVKPVVDSTVAERPLSSASAGRGRARCFNCAVVESVRRVDRREALGGVCLAGDRDGSSLHIVRAAGERSLESASLDDTVNSAIAGESAHGKFRVTTSYQLVVRFRDGSRRIFNEVTARSLQTGDRVTVIAGIN